MFVVAVAVIISMYGGGFATIPAYLRDLFGTFNVGAIHGRLLTAWAVAGVLGPELFDYIREFQIDHGVPKAQAYSITMYVMCGLLFVGFLCNVAMRPVNPRFHYRPPGTAKPRSSFTCAVCTADTVTDCPLSPCRRIHSGSAYATCVMSSHA